MFSGLVLGQGLCCVLLGLVLCSIRVRVGVEIGLELCCVRVRLCCVLLGLGLEQGLCCAMF